MAEPIRLVIWDLDETFWRGTLTEGGIEYQETAHAIVIELAGRGIMSSICSRNDFESVRKIMTAAGIWDFFVFPSINWQSKGPRVAQIIDDMQLRAASVLFVDDNPMNLHEAMHSAPGLQVAGPALLTSLLDDPRVQGKNDSDHARLKQYKLLERRYEAKTVASDNNAFLRSSEIRVTVDADIEPHIDRVIELINRTNQLNFTKKRLPEDAHQARKQLLEELGERNAQAGIVHVTDKYGDYGITGFYLLHVHTWRLVHFCFSCRTMGMGIERWLYEKLRRPALAIVGEVLSDLSEGLPSVDYINSGPLSEARSTEARDLGRILVRGGCEMQGLAHYFALHANELTTEFGFDRGGLPIPVHHSVFLRAAIDGVSEEQVAAAARIGYQRKDFESQASTNSSSYDYDIYVYSFWADAHYALYRDPLTSITVPFGIHWLNNGVDLRQLDELQRHERLTEPGMAEKWQALRLFEYMGWSLGIEGSAGLTLFEENLQAIFQSSSKRSKIFILLGCERVSNGGEMNQPVEHLAELNRQIRRTAAGHSNVYLLDPLALIQSPSDIIDATHFDRRVYFRAYQQIVEWASNGDAAEFH